MCYYCDINNYTGYPSGIVGLTIEEGMYDDLAFEYNASDGSIDLIAYGEYEARKRINYCPFCGRKLSILKTE